MSENKKETNLPGKDYFHSYKGDESKKRRAREITEEEKTEFAVAFGEEEVQEDVKTYVPGGKKNMKKAEKAVKPETKEADRKEKAVDSAKAEKAVKTEKNEKAAKAAKAAKTDDTVKAQPIETDEDMYALPEFNAEEIFATLGIKIKADETASKDDNLSKTMAFSSTQVKEELEDITNKKPADDPLGNTRYFSLRTKNKKPSSDKNKKNLMQNFRVLSKNREDRAILEAAPSGAGGKGFADLVKAQQGEDVFEAVEKAYEKKTEKPKKSEKPSPRKERNIKGAKKGEQVLNDTKKQLKRLETGMIVYAVLFALSIVLSLVFHDTVFCGAGNLLVSVAACAMSYPVFEKSFKAIKSLNAVSDTALSVMSFFVVLHNICALMLKQNVSVYTLCVIFALFMRICSEHLRLKSRARLVSMALRSKNLSILQRIPVKKDAISFTRNTAKNEEPDIFYCADAMLDTSIEEPQSENIRENKYYIFAMSFVLLAGLVVGLFCFTTEMTGFSFVTALTATVCALLPVMYDPLSRLIFYRNGKDMLGHGACISGREALTHIGRSDGFVLDAGDVFAGEVSRFRKSAISKMDQNDSAVFAALLIREAGSVLAPCFDSFLEQMNIVLPPVENFLYEERQGYSAWVLDRKVLVGNRQMLLNHSISVPSKEQEKAYGKGRYVMYVVIDGEITATFLVGYKVISSLKRYSRDFNKTGLVLMISSKEAFLNEEAVAVKLSIDASSVKVLSSKAAAIMDKYNDKYEKQTPTGLLCSGKKHSIMHLIMGCYNANANDRLILIMMLLGQLLGFLVLVLSAVLNMKLFFNPLAIVAIRLLWSLVIKLVIERKK